MIKSKLSVFIGLGSIFLSRDIDCNNESNASKSEKKYDERVEKTEDKSENKDSKFGNKDGRPFNFSGAVCVGINSNIYESNVKLKEDGKTKIESRAIGMSLFHAGLVMNAVTPQAKNGLSAMFNCAIRLDANRCLGGQGHTSAASIIDSVGASLKHICGKYDNNGVFSFGYIMGANETLGGKDPSSLLGPSGGYKAGYLKNFGTYIPSDLPPTAMYMANEQYSCNRIAYVFNTKSGLSLGLSYAPDSRKRGIVPQLYDTSSAGGLPIYSKHSVSVGTKYEKKASTCDFSMYLTSLVFEQTFENSKKEKSNHDAIKAYLDVNKKEESLFTKKDDETYAFNYGKNSLAFSTGATLDHKKFSLAFRTILNLKGSTPEHLTKEGENAGHNFALGGKYNLNDTVSFSLGGMYGIKNLGKYKNTKGEDKSGFSHAGSIASGVQFSLLKNFVLSLDYAFNFAKIDGDTLNARSEKFNSGDKIMHKKPDLGTDKSGKNMSHVLGISMSAGF
jgi:hypothetical protein